MGYYYLVLESILGTDLSNPLINAFTYESTEITPTSAGAAVLASEFRSILLEDSPPLLALLPTDVSFTGITVTAPQVPTVLYVEAISIPGEGAGDYLTAYNAMEFQSPRTLANIRPGMKRFGPILKANVADGVYASGAVALAEGVAGSLSAVLSGSVSGITVNFTPVIVKRIPYETESGRTAYRLPNGLDTYVRSIADNWAYKRITTQNTRKR